MEPQKSWNTDESAFVCGRAKNLRLGGYGGTVKLWIRGRDLVMERSATGKHRRKQMTAGPNTPTARADLVEIGVEVVEDLAKHAKRGVANTAPPPPVGTQTQTLTVGRILYAHLRAACPNAPPVALHIWGRPQIRKHFEGMPPSLRRAAQSVDQVAKILGASRSFFKTKAFRADRPYDELEFTDFRDYFHRLLDQGRSPETANTYLSVLRAAIRGFSVDHHTEWDGRHDITQNGWARLPTERLSREGYTAEQFRDVTLAAHRLGDWRLAGTLLLLGGTGRRIGDMGVGRDEGPHKAPPLCGNDFREGEDGRLFVTFRANRGKGGNFGRGDVVRDVPDAIAPYIRRLLVSNPNPLGSAYPVFWKEDDARTSVTDSQMREAFDAAWEEAYPGTERPTHRAFHAMGKASITEVAMALGTETAADWCGKTPAIVEVHYRDKRPQDVSRATRHVSQALGSLLPREMLEGPAARR